MELQLENWKKNKKIKKNQCIPETFRRIDTKNRGPGKKFSPVRTYHSELDRP